MSATITTTPAVPAAERRPMPAPPKPLTRPRTAPENWRPDVLPLIVDGKPAVAVALFGPTADGARMLLDAATWHRVTDTWGPHWYLNDRGGNAYVGCCRKAAISSLMPPRERRSVFASLSRLLTGAPDGADVVHLNSDNLDLRAGNLRVVAANERRREMATQVWSRRKLLNAGGVH